MSPIADVLRLAANRCLSRTGARVGRKTEFSCDAVTRTHTCLGVPFALMEATFEFLENLGVNTESSAEMIEFEPGIERQSVRYCWLMFAADLADEWGIE